MSPSILPTVWVMNCVDAACLSCSSHVIGIIRHPSCSNIRKKLWHLSLFTGFSALTLTLSNIMGSPSHDALPLSGPNIGWVHRMSNSSGTWRSISFFGNSLTDRTSTNRVFLLSLKKGKLVTTCSVESMLVQSTTTSGCSSQKSSTLEKYLTPSSFAKSWYRSDLDVASTVCPWETKRFARNCPKVPKPTTPILSLGTSQSGSLWLPGPAASAGASRSFFSFCFFDSKSKGWAASRATQGATPPLPGLVHPLPMPPGLDLLVPPPSVNARPTRKVFLAWRKVPHPAPRIGGALRLPPKGSSAVPPPQPDSGLLT
mmetsp:Transcript_1815/g.6108  ORF Transcript_1815/g.6108 Transcript_1815/m.6108 type:complete len:314 (-) Transcript_1815:5-946(-)